VKCAAQLKQWGMVIALYQTENQDWFGIQWTGLNADGTRNANDKHTWNTVAVGTPNIYDTEWGSIEKGNVSKYSITMRVCPGDPVSGQYAAQGAAGDSQANRVLVDYAMIRYLPIGAGPTMWRVTQFTHPSTTILMMDSPSMGFNTDNSNMTQFYALNSLLELSSEPIGAGVPYSTILQQRHLGIGNVMFLDGHVEQHVKATDNLTSPTVPFGNDDYFKNMPSILIGSKPQLKDQNKIWTTMNTP
jgi:prepilin-type processing-associated H-X9-DG protein